MDEIEQNGPWATLARRVVYDNPWITVEHCEVLNPSGGPGIYGQVHFKNLAIGIVPVDENLDTWLVGQWRFPLREWSWEIPEGGGPLDESPLRSAQRELLEETGIRAARWTKLIETALSNSVSDERGVIFLAQELTFGAAQPEETEALEIRKLPLKEAFEMALRGEIADALSQIGLFAAWRALRGDDALI